MPVAMTLGLIDLASATGLEVDRNFPHGVLLTINLSMTPVAQ